MNEELYIEIKERLTEELGYEPSEDEVLDEFANLCDYEYERRRDDAMEGD